MIQSSHEQPSAISVSVVIKAFCRAGHFDAAKDLLRQLLQVGVHIAMP